MTDSEKEKHRLILYYIKFFKRVTLKTMYQFNCFGGKDFFKEVQYYGMVVAIIIMIKQPQNLMCFAICTANTDLSLHFHYYSSV